MKESTKRRLEHLEARTPEVTDIQVRVCLVATKTDDEGNRWNRVAAEVQYPSGERTEFTEEEHPWELYVQDEQET